MLAVVPVPSDVAKDHFARAETPTGCRPSCRRIREARRARDSSLDSTIGLRHGTPGVAVA
jgi:hypothetical protein